MYIFTYVNKCAHTQFSINSTYSKLLKVTCISMYSKNTTLIITNDTIMYSPVNTNMLNLVNLT